MYLPKVLMYLYTKWLAAKTHLADGEFVQGAVNREEFLKI